jgi:hypothetical protein
MLQLKGLISKHSAVKGLKKKTCWCVKDEKPNQADVKSLKNKTLMLLNVLK